MKYFQRYEFRSFGNILELLKKQGKSCMIKVHEESEDSMLAKRTDAQAEQQDKYMSKLQDIKVRVPKEQYQIIKDYADKQGKSINKLIISLLEKEIGQEFPSIREQNKANKES